MTDQYKGPQNIDYPRRKRPKVDSTQSRGKSRSPNYFKCQAYFVSWKWGFLSSVIEINFVPLPNWSLPHKRPPHGILLLQKGIRLYVTYRINNSIPSVSISALPSTYLMLHKHCRFSPNMLHFFIHSHYWTCLPSQLYMPHHGLIIILYNYLCLSMLSLKSRAMSYSNFHSICPPTISGLGMHSGDSWVNS